MRSALKVGALLLSAALALPAIAAEVVILKSVDAPAWRPALEAFRRGAGGHTIAEIDLAGDRAAGERAIASIKGRSVVVVALGALAAAITRELAPELPLVYAMVPDPAKVGLVGHAAGVAFHVPPKNQLAAFRMVNPRAVRIGVIYNPENTKALVDEAKKGAGVVRLVVIDKPVASEREVPGAIRSLLKGEDEVDALWVVPDPIVLADETRRFLMQEAIKAGKPVYSSIGSLVPEGALVSNGADMTSIGSQLAELVGRVAAGEKAGGIESAIPRAELLINKKIADKLKVEIPADALRAAAKVF